MERGVKREQNRTRNKYMGLDLPIEVSEFIDRGGCTKLHFNKKVKCVLLAYMGQTLCKYCVYIIYIKHFCFKLLEFVLISEAFSHHY